MYNKPWAYPIEAVFYWWHLQLVSYTLLVFELFNNLKESENISFAEQLHHLKNNAFQLMQLITVIIVAVNRYSHDKPKKIAWSQIISQNCVESTYEDLGFKSLRPQLKCSWALKVCVELFFTKK